MIRAEAGGRLTHEQIDRLLDLIEADRRAVAQHAAALQARDMETASYCATERDRHWRALLDAVYALRLN